MHRRIATTLSLLAVLAIAPAADAANPPAVKPIHTLIQSVRYERDRSALKQLDGETQGQVLMGDAWEKGTPEQRKEFTELFHTIFAKVAFPKLRENFEHLGAVTYGDPEVNGKQAKVESTLVIMHPLKKQELKTKYTLARGSNGWKVVDVLVVGQPDSMLNDIREREIAPRLKKGGWDEVLRVMREFAKKLEGQKLK